MLRAIDVTGFTSVVAMDSPTELAVFLEAVIAAFAVLGGAMASLSGYLAASVYWTTRSGQEMADGVNEGIALGFTFGGPVAIVVFILVGSV
jgi:hypothetical protein